MNYYQNFKIPFKMIVVALMVTQILTNKNVMSEIRARNDQMLSELKQNFDMVFKKFTPEDFYSFYVSTFKKEYDTDDEAKYRFNMIKQNAEEISDFNHNNQNVKLGITPFIDMSPNEFKFYYLMNEETADYLRRKAIAKRKSQEDRLLENYDSKGNVIGWKYNSRQLQSFPSMSDFMNSSGFTSIFPKNDSSSFFSNNSGFLNTFGTFPNSSQTSVNPPTPSTLTNQTPTNTDNTNKTTNSATTPTPVSSSDTNTSPNNSVVNTKGFTYPKKVFKDYREANKLINKKTYNTNEYAKYINWAEAGKVSNIRSQGKCASCYVFSTVAAIEALSLIHNNKSYDLSEQEMIDCTVKYGNEGCKGGLQSNVIDYVVDKGINLESSYPYAGVEKSCESSPNNRINYKKLDYVYLDNNVLALIAALNYGPVTIAFMATPLFFKYTSGVIDETICTTDDKVPNHSTLVVGYDLNAKVPHFIVKNSWGDKWGETGYFKIKIGELSTKNTGMCGLARFDINTMAIYVL